MYHFFILFGASVLINYLVKYADISIIKTCPYIKVAPYDCHFYCRVTRYCVTRLNVQVKSDVGLKFVQFCYFVAKKFNMYANSADNHYLLELDNFEMN